MSKYSTFILSVGATQRLNNSSVTFMMLIVTLVEAYYWTGMVLSGLQLNLHRGRWFRHILQMRKLRLHKN